MISERTWARIGGAAAALAATPEGGWPETQQAYQQYSDIAGWWEESCPSAGGNVWLLEVSAADAIAEVQRRGGYVHPSRRASEPIYPRGLDHVEDWEWL